VLALTVEALTLTAMTAKATATAAARTMRAEYRMNGDASTNESGCGQRRTSSEGLSAQSSMVTGTRERSGMSPDAAVSVDEQAVLVSDRFCLGESCVRRARVGRFIWDAYAR
jgi:hypothetical protein